jgi:hypothetical protein
LAIFFTVHQNHFPIHIGCICHGVSHPHTTAAPLLLLLFCAPALPFFTLLPALLLLRKPALLLLSLLLLLFRIRSPAAPASLLNIEKPK